MNLPTGTVTFLFTDIEGSTRLWEEHPDSMRAALARHNVLVAKAVESEDGHVFKTVGDTFCTCFAKADQAVGAAAAVQRLLQSELWPEGVALRVRVALHTGAADEESGDYFGPPLNRVARLLSTAHGGQVLLSGVTRDLCRDSLPEGCTLLPLGEHRLKDLGRPEAVFQLCHPDLPSQFPPLRSLDNPALPNNLPQQVTSFVGREKQLRDLIGLFQKSRLLTLTGSGGCGKTRLALQAAANMLDRFEDGAWLVELAALSDSSLVPQTVATVLGVKEETGRSLTQTLTTHLKVRHLLLVLDNCEHLLQSCATLTDSILKTCPGVLVLATSREGLGIAGERSYRVPSLTSPDPKRDATPESLSPYEAVQLFIERAQRHLPTFAVTNSNAPALAAVCHRLDGIPLAIELAAARVRSLSVEEVNQRLDQRFRLLTGGSRTALPRQQTLRSLIDWSYDLLNGQEKALLCRLSVFSGGWTVESAEQVCAGEPLAEWETLDVLTSLADKSLATADTRGGATRYRLLETVRQYGRDRLLDSGEGELWRNRHLAYYVTLAEAAEPHLTGAEQQTWLDRLEMEHDNLRAALEWCSEKDGDLEMGLRIAASIWQFWHVRGYLGEGRSWLAGLLDPLDRPARGGDVHSAARAKALNGAGVLAVTQGDPPAARTLHETSLAIFRELGDRRGIAASLNNLGNVAYGQADYPDARMLYEESLTIRRELGDRSGIAASLNNLGNVAYCKGDYQDARTLYQESLAIRRELGNRGGVAASLDNLGNVANSQGDYPTARALIEESLAIRRELGNRGGIAMSLNNLGSVAYGQGDYPAARTLLEESLAIRWELGDRWDIGRSTNNLGSVAQKQGDYPSARALHEESLTINRELGDRRGIASSLDSLGSVAQEQGDYPSARAFYEESLTINRELGDRSGIASSLNHLGHVAHAQGDYPSARALHEESLTIKQELGDRRGIAESLEGLAPVLAALGIPDRAARLWGYAERLREEIGSPLPPNDRPRYERQVSEARSAADGDAAFDAAWQEGRAMTLEQAMKIALPETGERTI